MIPLLKSNGMNLTGTPGDIGSAYFFHYSYIIFLFLLLVYSYSIKVKGEYMNKLFNFILVSKRTEYKIRRYKTLNLYSNGKEETQISQLQDKCRNGAVTRRIN